MTVEPAPETATPRDAATLILVRRDGAQAPRVLMGQRGAAARFMPSKFVFPGGAIEAPDRDLAERLAAGPRRLASDCLRRLALDAPDGIGLPLALTAIRETFEETGLALGARDETATDAAAAVPESWRPFFARGVAPALDALTFVFRAITPPTRPVRFDARFFMAEAGRLAGDPDDFADAEAELSHLSWLTLEEARRLDLPFITGVVLAEVEMRLERPEARPIPFFRHDGTRSLVDALE